MKRNFIDHRTLAIQPHFTGNYRSIITKTDGIYYSELTPLELIEDACLRYFTTMEGRQKAIGIMLNFKKAPIVIATNLGAFPTTSPKHPDCEWIFNHPFQATDVTKGKAHLTFTNGTSLTLNVSAHTVRQQQQRLHTILDYYHRVKREDKHWYSRLNADNKMPEIW